MGKRYIVELEEGVYIADWEGDPGRTTRRGNAMVFDNRWDAVLSAKKAQTYRPFVNAMLIRLNPDKKEAV